MIGKVPLSLPLCIVLGGALSASPVKLLDVVTNLQKECRCQLGVAAERIEDPSNSFEFGEKAYPTASTYKLPIAVAFLELVDAGKFVLDQRLSVKPIDIVHGVSRIADEFPHGGNVPASRLVSLMISESDNSASDAILRTLGGAAIANTLLAEKHISGIHINGPERDMQTCADPPRDSATPHAMVRLLAALYQGKLLKPATTEFSIRALEQTKTFPGRIKGLLPPGTVVGHKTGTGDCATNDVGVITLPNGRGHLAIAVYLRGSHLTANQNDAIIAEVSKAAFDSFLN